MSARRSLALISLIAALHGVFFIWYQRPDWHTQWSDQDGYRRLGHVLAETGTFTRYPDSPTFVPEVLRTPLYPMFVAVVYRVAGEHHAAVALAQTPLFVLICLLVYAITTRLASSQVALAAAAATAIFPPLPYFGALVMTELWTAFVFTAGMWAIVRAIHIRTARAFALAGFLLSAAALSRPVFFLFPLALALAGVVVPPIARVSPRPPLRSWAVMLVAAGVTLLPWFIYNYEAVGRITMSPAGGVGRGIWEGSWQAVWSGRLQDELTKAGETAANREALDAQVQALASRERQDAAPMLEYVHQWDDIRRIWTEPVDPQRRAPARIEADREYLRVGLNNLRHQSAAHLAKRVARGVFVLWAGEVPFRYSTINDLPRLVIYGCWMIQAVIAIAALCGLIVLFFNGAGAPPPARADADTSPRIHMSAARCGRGRKRRTLDALVLGAPMLYVTAAHALLLTEARQSLPAMPIVLLLATIGVAALLPSRHHLLSLEPQVHEREHL